MNTYLIAVVLSVWLGLTRVLKLSGLNFRGILTTSLVSGLVVGDINLGFRVATYWIFFELSDWSYFDIDWQPDMALVAMFSVFFSERLGYFGLGISVGPIVAINIDILTKIFDQVCRMTNTIFQQKADRALARNSLKSFEKWTLMGVTSWFISQAIPVFLFLILYYDTKNSGRPTFFTDWLWEYYSIVRGLEVVGSALPAVGFAMLLSRMDLKRFWPYLVIGFFFYAFFKVNTTFLFLIGLSFAFLHVLCKAPIRKAEND